MKKNNFIPNHHCRTKKKTQTIRIIGGKWKGKKIIVPYNQHLRPTTNQIRETLFNWLNPIIYGAQCLDCFAGSGSLGLEALSRYANTVTFLEKNKTIYKKLHQTIRLLNIEKQTRIINIDCNIWLAKTVHINIQPYNLVFLDPPFKKQHYISHIIQLLEKFQHLAENTWIYIEKPKYDNNNSTITIPKNWQLHKKKTTGNVSYQLYIKSINKIYF